MAPPASTHPPPWRAWYDDQCEVCQAGVAWLRWLDGGRGRVESVAISGLLDAEGDGRRPPGSAEDDLLRELHVQAPDGTVHVGAAAVARLARLFPLTTTPSPTLSARPLLLP